MTVKSVSDPKIVWLSFRPAASWTSLIAYPINFSSLICIKLILFFPFNSPASCLQNFTEYVSRKPGWWP